MDQPGRPDRRGLSGEPGDAARFADRSGPADGAPAGARAEPGPAVDLDRLLDRTTFPPAGTPITCAVSGGADSLALLVLARRAGCQVTAVHVDHGLRPGSAAEAEVVAAAAERFGAAFRAEAVEVGAAPNPAARARTARYAVLPADVCTGHTADDRAETVLINLLRGAGPAGLGALAPSARRPLVGLRRHETVALCAALGLAPVQDPSNYDPAFLRNRVRHELVPLLADLADRDPVPILTRQADLFATLDADLRAAAADVDAADVAALRAAAPSIARVAIRGWLVDAGVGDGHTVDAAAIERVLDVVHHRARATEVAGGWRADRRDGRLHLHPPADL